MLKPISSKHKWMAFFVILFKFFENFPLKKFTTNSWETYSLDLIICFYLLLFLTFTQLKSWFHLVTYNVVYIFILSFVERFQKIVNYVTCYFRKFDTNSSFSIEKYTRPFSAPDYFVAVNSLNFYSFVNQFWFLYSSTVYFIKQRHFFTAVTLEIN
jgi:hypothetical protein